MDKPAFQVGEKVRVKYLEIPEERDYIGVFNPSDGTNNMGYMLKMQDVGGKEFEISRVIEQPFGYIYRLKGDSYYWAWTEEMLEPANKPTTNAEAKSFLILEEEY